jgi:hypothetical protein
VDALTFIDHLVGRLAWPAAVVAVAWAARGPLLALAGRHGPPPAAPSGTGDKAGAAAAEHTNSADPDRDARADQAALLGASLAVVLTQFFGPGSWGWWSTGIGLTLLLIVLGYVRISRDPQLGWRRRIGRLLGFAAVIGLCSTVAFAYALQTAQDDSKNVPGTNGRSVKDFCTSLGVAASSKAVDEADKKLPNNEELSRINTTEDEVLTDARRAAHKQAYHDCLGQYGSTHLELVGLSLALVAFTGAFIWSLSKPSSPSG